MSPRTKSIGQCLRDCGISSAEDFDSCENTNDEFRVVKRAYFAKSLVEHPDKGGDAELFRKTRTAFEVIRDLKDKGHLRHSFKEYLADVEDTSADYNYDDVYQNFNSSEVPSYDHFAEAAAVEVPGYFVEPAKSARSQCVKCKARKGRTKKDISTMGDTTSTAIVTTGNAKSSKCKGPTYIAKDALRVGSLDSTAGSYGRWNHLPCWRVPYRVWSGLTMPEDPRLVLQDLLGMNEVLLAGLSDLTDEQKELFVSHCMEQGNWARKTKKRAKPEDDEIPASKSKRPKKESSDLNTKRETAITVSNVFIIPSPDSTDVVSNVFAGKRFVLTGVFPEIGGGAGLNLGKDRLKKTIESFGGRVTSAVSGKTDYLIAGKDPGASKFTKAAARRLPIMSTKSVRDVICGGLPIEDIQNISLPAIESFSAGYSNNRIAY
mmetsp:Transcript_19355/g.28647  ORF Transcript_19355/g.28647 Transcript_19355/m.28647 type:complete len:432 (-) Transcript_19355:3379-4674(-)|eukprot:CAMPEP_0194254132 /NCGR_PEP_ID=MMETSP0158-20130606/31441_1 /TAXON_ID=33649 /ORGANISM="Thalassionema nitzschioides, Strain L26-B" /LENGTH=431 /DNA_ID=CAMNT_0038992057 /DNA_START=237 /DNA_END=1532 /DNA_ORIENTATION=+